MDLLVVPYPIDPTLNIIQWSLFLITGKVSHNPFKVHHICELFLFLTVCLPLQIYAAMKNVLSILFDEAESQERDSEIWRLICRDECTKLAVIEFHEFAKHVLRALMVTENEKRFLHCLVPFVFKFQLIYFLD